MKTTMSLLQISFLLFVFSCTNSNNTSTGLLTASSATDKNVEQQFNSIKENTVENTEQKPDSVKERTIENIEFILANSTARNWVNYYKLYDSTFSLHNFIGGREYEMQETEGCICATFDDCFDKRFTNLLIYSPDKKMYVDINSYGMALDENNNAIFDVVTA